MKIAIIYHSKSGNTQKIAEMIGKGIKKAENIEVKLMGIDEVDYKFVKESKAIIFGTPTHYGNISWQMKKWFDESWRFNLEGKIGAVFATTNYLGGGVDIALMTLIEHMMIKGMLLYSGASELEQPYIHIGFVAIKNGDENQKDKAKLFGKIIGKKLLDIFGNDTNEVKRAL